MSKRVILLLVIALATVVGRAQQLQKPDKPDSLRFAVMGDTGTGAKTQYQIAQRLAGSRAKFPFEFVIMLGDNLYGGEAPKDFQNKFEKPYQALLSAGVKFYASL